MPLLPPSPRRLIALVDASNFYVSCERVFRPDLARRPVVVLSNNDGCIVSRSDEVKAFGTPMAAPYFKLRRGLEARGTVAFSSNYPLYADFHRRVVETLRTFTPDVEPYSIDEAFLHLATPTPELRDPARLRDLARSIHSRVRAWTKIPVRVSIAATKTLAKVGSRHAKAELRAGRPPAVCLHGWAPDALDALLGATPVGDVWGVGRRHRERLLAAGVDTARALRDRPDAWVRRRMHTPGLRTVYELRGTACITERGPRPRRSIARSRSFSRPATAFRDVREALAVHAESACARLRAEGMAARAVQVFFHTGHGGARGPHRSASRAAALPLPTNDTAEVTALTHRLLAEAWDGAQAFPYRKAGVLLLDLTPAASVPPDLFVERRPERAALAAAVDRLNARFGQTASGRPPVYVAAAGPGDGAPTETGHDWAMRQAHLSPFAPSPDGVPSVRLAPGLSLA